MFEMLLMIPSGGEGWWEELKEGGRGIEGKEGGRGLVRGIEGREERVGERN